MNGLGESTGVAERLETAAELVRMSSMPMSPLQRMEGLRLVNTRLAQRRPSSLRSAAIAFVSVGAVATACLLLARSHARNQARNGTTTGVGSIAYHIEGGEIGGGGYIRSDDARGARVRFDEGSELHLFAGARGRLSAVDARGARLAIEEGQAEVKVTPRPGARWLVDAGPFLITVQGTVFTAAWDGDKERLDIHMTKGLVSVSGPLGNGSVAVRAGQHLSVNVRSNEVSLQQIDRAEQDDVDTKGTGAPPPTEQPRVMPSAVQNPGSRPAQLFPRASASGIGYGWPAALVAGDLDSILYGAERKGIGRVLNEASSEDLAALADAARYGRRNDLAQRALLAQRTRFPRSFRASDAAFLLGRIEETRPHGESRALRWYDLYLKEAPFGAYASEALGRKMTATERARGPAAARANADEYLRRFPNGTYAGTARVLRDGT